jgi:NADH-quinone oxidoreductase subunit A
MLEKYLPILIFLAIAAGLGGLLIVLGYVLGPRKPDAEKRSSYECGFEPFEESRMRFDVRYYLVAILFIVFDLETALLVPFAVGFKGLPYYAWAAVLGIFLPILIVGFIYEWGKGALEWD